MAIKLNIGKPKAPVQSLADELKAAKPRPEGDDIPLSQSAAKQQSPLAIALNKPTVEKEPIIVIETNIPTVTAEKYALLAKASDTLKQTTIDEFNLRMNYIINSMDNPELPDAMKRVLEYCQEHNELQQWLREDDIAIFVQGARRSYAAVAAKKTSNRTKRSKSAEFDANAIEALMDLEIDI